VVGANVFVRRLQPGQAVRGVPFQPANGLVSGHGKRFTRADAQR
jgi:hypothetical protein